MSKFSSGIVYLLCAMCYLLPSGVYADVPHLLRYQGTAVDSNGVGLEGPYNLTFRLYDAVTAGNKVWEETLTNVSITKGYFSVLLGQITSLQPMDWNKPCWLSIQVNTDSELSPRQQFTSVPTAVVAERLGNNVYTTTDGKVGIGKSNPSGSLDIYEGGKCLLHIPKQLNINDDVYIYAGDTGGVKIGQTDHSSIIQVGHSGTMGFINANYGDIMIDPGDDPRDGVGPGNIAIGYTLNPTNILTVKQGSETDPIADSWTVYPSDRSHKNIIGAAPIGFLDEVKGIEVYEWTRIAEVSDDEAKKEAVKSTGKDDPTPSEVDAKKQELEKSKSKLPKFSKKRVGMAIDDPNVPQEILAFNNDGSPQGIDLLAYIGYLHAALKEAALKIDELEARVNSLESQ